jgi:hypothetical protein
MWVANEWTRFTDFVQSRFDRGVLKGGICVEQHLDGTPHVHIIAMLGRKLHTRDVTAFDDLYNQHPNWRHVKDWRKGTQYLSKGPYFFFTYDHEEVLNTPYEVFEFLLINNLI